MAAETNPKVSLGCGTLILIALIVLFLGNANDGKEVLKEIRELKQQIERMEKRLRPIEEQLKAQSETLRKLPFQRPPRPRIVSPANPEPDPELADPPVEQ